MRLVVAQVLLLSLWAMSAVAATIPPEKAEDGLELALHRTASLHPSVKSKLEELRALGFDLDSAKAQRYPLLGLEAGSTVDVAGSATATSGSDRLDRVQAVVKQPLWVGGRIDGAIDQAAVREKTGSLALLATQRQLMEETAATYAAILGARNRLTAAQENVAEHERLQQLITRRQDGGVASEADMQLASSRVSQAMAQQQQLQGALATALNQLQALTQQPIAAQELVPAGLHQLPVEASLAAEVEEVSASIRQRQAEVELARTAADLAKADMMPSLYAKVEQDLLASSDNGDDLLGTRVGLVLEGSINGMGLTGWNKVQSAETRIGAAKREVEAARTEVRRTVQALLIDLRSNELIAASNERLVQSTRQTLESFMRQYDAGRKSWLDVLNTQRDLASARLDLEQSRSALLATRLRLAVLHGQFDQLAGVRP